LETVERARMHEAVGTLRFEVAHVQSSPQDRRCSPSADTVIPRTGRLWPTYRRTVFLLTKYRWHMTTLQSHRLPAHKIQMAYDSTTVAASSCSQSADTV